MGEEASCCSCVPTSSCGLVLRRWSFERLRRAGDRPDIGSLIRDALAARSARSEWGVFGTSRTASNRGWISQLNTDLQFAERPPGDASVSARIQLPSRLMFELFDSGARLAVVLSEHESRRFGYTDVATFHLAMALADVSESSTRLAELNVSRPLLRGVAVSSDDLHKYFGNGGAASADLGWTVGARVPFTPDSRAVLERSMAVSKSARDKHIGCEHLMVALLSIDGRLRQFFSAAGIDPGAPPAAWRPDGWKPDSGRARRKNLRQTKKSSNRLQTRGPGPS